MSERCPICNIWNADDAKFCRNCGKQLETGATNVSSSSSSSSDAGDIFLKVLGTILVVGICIAIAVGTAGIGTPVAIGGFLALREIWK